MGNESMFMYRSWRCEHYNSEQKKQNNNRRRRRWFKFKPLNISQINLLATNANNDIDDGWFPACSCSRPSNQRQIYLHSPSRCTFTLKLPPFLPQQPNTFQTHPVWNSVAFNNAPKIWILLPYGKVHAIDSAVIAVIDSRYAAKQQSKYRIVDNMYRASPDRRTDGRRISKILRVPCLINPEYLYWN